METIMASSDLTDLLRGVKEAGFDLTITPGDASAGKLDQDELLRAGAGLALFVAALILLLAPIRGVDRQLVVGAAIPMFGTAAATAIGTRGGGAKRP